MERRVYNFSAGPAMLPVPVLEQARDEMLSLPGVGASVVEISHRSKPFEDILDETEANLRRLLAIPSNYQLLFLQGGARLQFTMIPKNLVVGGNRAAYVVTGSWGKYAAADAKLEDAGDVAWTGAETNFDRIPAAGEVSVPDDAAYVHITSNETIQGVQFPTEPDYGAAPLVADCSSEILSRPIDVEKYGLIYACAQKNAGIAGVTLVIIRDDLLERSPADLPGMLSYAKIAEAKSCLNTPPVFAIYMMNLVARWLRDEIGGLGKMAKINAAKAAKLYHEIDSSEGFYIGHAQTDCRSLMNVPFRLADDALTKEFMDDAKSRGMIALGGHRSVGGMRASIYNAMPTAGVDALCELMREFRSRHAPAAV